MKTDEQRGWRVGHRGRDQMYYEERHGLTWERIEIDGEMLMGEAHHVIYFATPERWLSYPAWARDRRDEIIARITSEFRPPDYEYYGLNVGGDAPSTAPAPKASPPGPSAKPHTPRPAGSIALLFSVLLLFLIAAVMGWVVTNGIARGQTRIPLRVPTLRRPVLRDQEPAMFWVSIGIYAVIGGATLTLGLLGMRERRRL